MAGIGRIPSQGAHDHDDEEDEEVDIHQSVSGAKMKVPMPEPQMAMPGKVYSDFYFKCILIVNTNRFYTKYLFIGDLDFLFSSATNVSDQER